MLDRGNAEDDWAPNLDEPTFPLRMRALCNTVKRQLLGDSHDPWRAQADDVIAAPGTPVKSATTWLAWWRGQSSPQTAKLRAFERVSPGSSRWLQSSHYGSPIQRHLAALEVMALEAPSKGDWVELKTQRSAALLSKCHEAWSLLTSETAVDDESALHLSRQLGPNSGLPEPTLAYASDAERIHAKLGNLNPYHFEFSENVRHKFSASRRFGLVAFMVAMAANGEGRQSWWWHPWVFDLATLTALARAETGATLDQSPIAQLGEDLLPIVTISRAYWDHHEGTITPVVSFAPRMVTKEAGASWATTLLAARYAYYAQLREIGITFRDVYAIAQPVRVFGARRIRDNIMW